MGRTRMGRTDGRTDGQGDDFNIMLPRNFSGSIKRHIIITKYQFYLFVIMNIIIT